MVQALSTLPTRISRVTLGAQEFRVLRADRLSRRMTLTDSDRWLSMCTDRTAAGQLTTAWALAARSPRSLVYLPIRAHRLPDSAWPGPPLDLVLLHASLQFRISAWKDVRARLGVGAPHLVDLPALDKQFPAVEDVDFERTLHRGFRDYLHFSTAADTLFVTGSASAFERSGAELRSLVEEAPAAHVKPSRLQHQCAEIDSVPWRTGRNHTRRTQPWYLHVEYVPTGW